MFIVLTVTDMVITNICFLHYFTFALNDLKNLLLLSVYKKRRIKLSLLCLLYMLISRQYKKSQLNKIIEIQYYEDNLVSQYPALN